jgi:hypothetical protein
VVILPGLSHVTIQMLSHMPPHPSLGNADDFSLDCPPTAGGTVASAPTVAFFLLINEELVAPNPDNFCCLHYSGMILCFGAISSE